MNSAPILIQPDIITLRLVLREINSFRLRPPSGRTSLMSVARAELPPKSQRGPFSITQFAGRVMADTRPPPDRQISNWRGQSGGIGSIKVGSSLLTAGAESYPLGCSTLGHCGQHVLTMPSKWMTAPSVI